jgi:hypothetical protein
MRRVLVALAMIAASVFMAAPAIAQEDSTGTSNEGTADGSPPPPEGSGLLEDALQPPADDDSPRSDPETQAEDEDVAAQAQDPDKVKNITICHRTNSETNPYNEITVSAFSIVKDNGHDSHDGPVFEPGLKDQQIKWGDIIPEFDYDGGNQHYDGKNLADGSDILANGCLVPGETPGDDDGGGDDDGDDDGDDSDDHEAALPDTGGPSPMIPLMGGLLTAFGIAILLRNGSVQGPAAGRHVRP